jgi:hypothetical protein
MLSAITITVANRQWMRAAKAWRIFLDIPDDPILPSALTALIDRQVKITLTTHDITIIINPAYVVDVPSKGRKFQLVVETVYEHQTDIGPKLTAMIGYHGQLAIVPVGAPQQAPETPRGDISEQTLRGLHVAFFKNPRFYRYLSHLTGATIGTPQQCKDTFKKHMGVESCKHLQQAQFDTVLRDFNAWIATKGADA